jgi:hypothetical protein
MALRGFCASDPMTFFAIMGSPRQADFVREIWSKVCERCDPIEQTDIRPEEIRVAAVRVETYPTLLIEMPEAEFPAEAIFVGIVLLAEAIVKAPPESVEFRYFTLELGEDLEGGERTVLCEWHDGSHLNMGDGPAPDLKKFAEAIGGRLGPSGK